MFASAEHLYERVERLRPANHEHPTTIAVWIKKRNTRQARRATNKAKKKEEKMHRDKRERRAYFSFCFLHHRLLLSLSRFLFSPLTSNDVDHTVWNLLIRHLETRRLVLF